jgi:hypothetical protein
VSSQDLVTQLKELLPDPTRRIELIDVVDSLTNDAASQLNSDAFPMSEQPSEESVRQRVEEFDVIIGPVGLTLVVGGYYGDMPYHFRIWSDVLERLAGTASGEPVGSWFEVWNGLRQYPPLIGLYALGIGTLAARRPEALAPCLAALSSDESAVRNSSVRPDAIQAAAAYLVPRQSRPTAVSSWLEDRLVSLSEGIIRAELLEVAFDQFEYLLGLIDAHRTLGPEMKGGIGARPSRFWFRGRPDTWITGVQAKAWLEAGMFDGSPDRLSGVRIKYEEAIAQQRTLTNLGF